MSYNKIHQFCFYSFHDKIWFDFVSCSMSFTKLLELHKVPYDNVVNSFIIRRKGSNASDKNLLFVHPSVRFDATSDDQNSFLCAASVRVHIQSDFFNSELRNGQIHLKSDWKHIYFGRPTLLRFRV